MAAVAIKDGDQSKIHFDESSMINNTTRRLSRASTDSNPSEPPTARRPSLLMTRRRSSFRNLAHTVNFMRRASMGKALKEKDDDKPKVKYENSYRMEPGEENFKCGKVRETVERLLNTFLRDVTYEERRCPRLTMDITTKVKNAVKDLNFKRYKIICNVILGEKKGQGVEAVGRCCWDSKTDTYVTVHFENDSLFAVCMVHGIYFE